MRKEEHSTLWVGLFCVSLLNSTQASIAVVGIPSHGISQNLDDYQLALLLGIFPIAASVAALFSGVLSDLLGRSMTLLSGLLVLGIALSCHVFATDFQTLLLLRGFSGLATGALTGLPSTLLSDAIPAERQITETGKTLSGHAIGQTLGIPTGIALLEFVSFPQLCFGIGLLILCLALVLRSQLPSQNLSKYYRSGELSAYAKGALSTLRDRQFAALAFCSYLSFTALSLFYIALALWLFREAQLRPGEIAPMHLIGGILQVLVLFFVIPRTSEKSPRTTVAFSLLLNSIIFAGAFFFLKNTTGASLVLALTLGAVALRIPSLQFVVNHHGGTRQKGLRMSLIQTNNHLGKASGYISAGYLSSVLEVHQIVLLCGILTFACSLILWAIQIDKTLPSSLSVASEES